MTNQILRAKNGEITDEMYQVSKDERLDAATIRQMVEDGTLVIVKNNKNEILPVALGNYCETKVFSCIANSHKLNTVSKKMDRMRVIQEAGAHILFDLTSYGSLTESRDFAISSAKIPVAVSPLLQVVSQIPDYEQNLEKITKEDILNEISSQVQNGASLIIINPSIIKYSLAKLENNNSLDDIFSKEAAILACYIKRTQKENPFYEYFDDILEILKSCDATLVLSSSLKSDNTETSFSALQILEYSIMSDLIEKARNNGVQVIVEAPKFITLDKIPQTIKIVKELTSNSPLFSSGLLASNSCFGYEHLASAIATSIGAYNGINLINCSSPYGEILTPNSAQVHYSIITSIVSAHCGDLARNNNKALNLNKRAIISAKSMNMEEIVKNSIDSNFVDKIDIKEKKYSFSQELIKKYF